MQLSKKVNSIHFSPIRKFNPLAVKAAEDGKKVYHLNIGQPDIPTPDCFMEAIRNFQDKTIYYTESNGYRPLLDSVVDYYAGYDITIDRSDIIVTTGGSEALSSVFTSILDEGDEVMVPEPFYTNYNTFVRSAGGFVVPVTTKPEDGYRYVDEELLTNALTPRTKAICVTVPGNPTGTALTLEDMRVIADFAVKHDLFLISDEVYREFMYDGYDVVSFLMLKDIQDRLIVIDSISKRFSACGARIGFVISKNHDVIDAVLKLAQGRLCSPLLDQVGAAELFKMPRSYYKEMRDEYEGRRNALCEELRKIPGIELEVPSGAFYLTCTLPVEDSEDLLTFLLTEFEDKGETMMYAPASGFYATPGKGLNEIRLAYVLNADDMRRGAELLRLGIEAYKKKGGPAAR